MQKAMLLLMAFWLVACSEKAEPIQLGDVAPSKDVLITITTDMGEMRAILYNETPVHKQNFVTLASKGAYDGSGFHRVIKGFMIQGGRVPEGQLSELAEAKGGMPSLPAEIRDGMYHKRGALAAARIGDAQNPERRSNASQFYIVQGGVFTETALQEAALDYRKLYTYFDSMMRNEAFTEEREAFYALQLAQDTEKLQAFIKSQKDKLEEYYGVRLSSEYTTEQVELYTTIGGYPYLDGQYTIFGEVIDGLEVIDRIAMLKTDGTDTPVEQVHMKVSAEVMDKSVIEERYGYRYADAP